MQKATLEPHMKGGRKRGWSLQFQFRFRQGISKSVMHSILSLPPFGVHQ